MYVATGGPKARAMIASYGTERELVSKCVRRNCSAKDDRTMTHTWITQIRPLASHMFSYKRSVTVLGT